VFTKAWLKPFKGQGDKCVPEEHIFG